MRGGGWWGEGGGLNHSWASTETKPEGKQSSIEAESCEGCGRPGRPGSPIVLQYGRPSSFQNLENEGDRFLKKLR